MLKTLSVLVAACAVAWVLQGWQISQIALAVGVIYLFVFYWRWLYVAARTACRDVTGFFYYTKILLLSRKFSKSNLAMSDIFHTMVLKHPNKSCFLIDDEIWTFGQVEEFSLRVSAVLKVKGVKKGDVVGVMMSNSPELPATWLGITRLGAIASLINTNQTGNTLLHSINIVKSDMVIYEDEYEEAFEKVKKDLNPSIKLLKYTHRPLNTSGNAVLVADSPNDFTSMLESTPLPPWFKSEGDGFNGKLLYIYTSGTTGLPKAAVISSSSCILSEPGVRYDRDPRCGKSGYYNWSDCHLTSVTLEQGNQTTADHANYTTAMVFMASGICYFGRLNPNIEVIYCPMPLYHSAGGCVSIGQALIFGCTIVLRKKFSASSYFKDCIKYNATAGHYIGEMCRYILATPPSPTDKQHKVRVIYGNGLRQLIWPEFVKRFNIKRVAEFYGATEGNANIVNVDNKMGAIGFVSRIVPKLYPIAILKVDKETGEPIRNSKGLCQLAKPDEPGVFIGKINPKLPSRAYLGYVDKEASEKKIVRDVFAFGDSAFISGDILVADELGYLYFRDRTGDTFRWRGENVSTTEVEAVISKVADHRDAAVYGVEIPNTEGRAGMCGIVDPDNSLDLDTLLKGIAKDLPKYARPIFIRRMTSLDMTGTFKIKKVDLQKEGYNPNRVSDKLYYLNPKLDKYLPLGTEEYEKIVSGQIRL